MFRVADMFRRVWVVGLCLGLLLNSTGATVTTVIAGPSDEWFPCIDHGCGCMSAEMCRTSCCCEPRRQMPAPFLPKPAPARVPAKKACCSQEKTADSTTDAQAMPGKASIGEDQPFPASSIRLAFRSAACSGRPPESLGQHTVLFVTPIESVRVKLIPLDRVQPVRIEMPSSLLALPDTPPPRPA